MGGAGTHLGEWEFILGSGNSFGGSENKVLVSGSSLGEKKLIWGGGGTH